jgi:hypothetical protein
VALRRHRLGWIALAALGALGVWIALDGLGARRRQHQIASLLVGAALLAPALGCLMLGRAWLTWLKNLAFGLMPLLLLCGALELVARVAGVETLLAPRIQPDPVLSFRMTPGSAGLDAWGFRNPSVPDHSDVVFLGDSQTYGFGVTRSEAYPSAFAEVSGLSSYNMGVGAYGPLQYLALVDQGLTLRPRVVVIGLYLGNDLLDAHHLLELPHWSRLRSRELRYRELPDPSAAPLPGRHRSLAVRALFAAERHSRLIGWVSKQLRLMLRTNQLLASIHEQEVGAPAYQVGAIRTRFTPAYRAQSLDPEREKVRDGLRVSGIALKQVQEASARAGAHTVLLLLHTKEHYYHALMRRRGEPTGWALDEVARMEGQMSQRLTELAAELGVTVLDPTEPMVAALAADRVLYPATADGHPTAEGHAVIAGWLWEQRVRWLGLDKPPAPGERPARHPRVAAAAPVPGT